MMELNEIEYETLSKNKLTPKVFVEKSKCYKFSEKKETLDLQIYARGLSSSGTVSFFVCIHECSCFFLARIKLFCIF